jgi:hypothetical protein
VKTHTHTCRQITLRSWIQQALGWTECTLGNAMHSYMPFIPKKQIATTPTDNHQPPTCFASHARRQLEKQISPRHQQRSTPAPHAPHATNTPHTPHAPNTTITPNTTHAPRTTNTPYVTHYVTSHHRMPTTAAAPTRTFANPNLPSSCTPPCFLPLLPPPCFLPLLPPPASFRLLLLMPPPLLPFLAVVLPRAPLTRQ